MFCISFHSSNTLHIAFTIVTMKRQSLSGNALLCTLHGSIAMGINLSQVSGKWERESGDGCMVIGTPLLICISDETVAKALSPLTVQCSPYCEKGATALSICLNIHNDNKEITQYTSPKWARVPEVLTDIWDTLCNGLPWRKKAEIASATRLMITV